MNGKVIPGETNAAIFINCLRAIGLRLIMDQCAHLFNTSLGISQGPIVATDYGAIKQIEENGVIFTVRYNSDTGTKVRQLEAIQKILDLDLTIKFG